VIDWAAVERPRKRVMAAAAAAITTGSGSRRPRRSKGSTSRRVESRAIARAWRRCSRLPLIHTCNWRRHRQRSRGSRGRAGDIASEATGSGPGTGGGPAAGARESWVEAEAETGGAASACRRSIWARFRSATAVVSVLRRKGRARRRPNHRPPASNNISSAAGMEAFIAEAGQRGLNFYVATAGLVEPVREASLQYRRLTMPSP
jgi:hypothetical protein